MDRRPTSAQRRMQHLRRALWTIAISVSAPIFIAAMALSLTRADDGKPKPAPQSTTPSDSAPAATLEVHVVGPDGKPVSHAKVDVRSTPRLQEDQVRVGKYQRRATYGVGITADANGHLVFTRPAGLKFLDFLLEIPGYAPYWTGWVPDVNSEPIPAELTIKLQSAWTVGSIVVDGDGQPIVGAEIWPVIEYAKGPGKTRQLVTGTHLRTDSNGRWSFDCAPDSVQAVQVEISKHDFMTLRTNLPRTKFGIKRGDKPAARVTLQAGLIVTGRVTDETGKPIAGAVVRTKFGNNVRKDVTSADGTYRVTGAEPGEARIVVSAKGRALEMKQVAIARGTNVDFILQPGRTVRVRVLDEKGHPLPRARIFFQRWRGPIQYFEFDSVTQYANKDGVWEWHEAPVDTFAADICRPGGMQLSYQPLGDGKEEYTFRVPPALVISGKVVDAKTKQALKTFRVVPGDRTSRNTFEGFTATDGHYRLRETYAQGLFGVRIEADGYFPADSRDIPTDSGNVTVDFDMKRGEDFVGTVDSPDGAPAAGAKLALGVHGAQIMVTNGHIDENQTYSLREMADPQGRFHFTPQVKDFWLVVTHPAGFAVLKCQAAHLPKEIRLTAWARVEGTFRVARKLQANVPIWINQWSHNVMAGDAPSILFNYGQTTAASGRFLFEHVAPGEGLIGRNLQLMAFTGSNAMTSSAMVPIKLKAGTTTHADLGTSGRPVVGQLQTPAESKEEVHWSFALIEVDGNGLHFAATADPHGNFCIDDVPAGFYSLSVRFTNDNGIRFNRRVEVPKIDEKLAQRPIDLGVLNLNEPKAVPARNP